MAEKNEVVYTWEQFDTDCKEIVEWTKRAELKFKGVFGIRRGGLVPAVALSHLLDLPLIVSEQDITKDTLIVDDIIDSGGTVRRLLSRIGEGYKVAVLFCNADTMFKPDFCARKKTGWVIFPWETRESSRYDETV